MSADGQNWYERWKRPSGIYKESAKKTPDGWNRRVRTLNDSQYIRESNMPKEGRIMGLLIREVHGENAHSEVAHTLAQIRQKCWIQKGRSVIKRINNKKCMVCKRWIGFTNVNYPLRRRTRGFPSLANLFLSFCLKTFVTAVELCPLLPSALLSSDSITSLCGCLLTELQSLFLLCIVRSSDWCDIERSRNFFSRGLCFWFFCGCILLSWFFWNYFATNFISFF